MKTRFFARSTHAFTMIELLTVIGIIAVLAAILFPVLSRVREGGRRDACISNLRQIHGALSMYLQDYDGVYPNAVSPGDVSNPERWNYKDPDFVKIIPTLPQFHTLMYPYIKSKEVFHCPSDNGLKYLDAFPGWLLEASPSSYAKVGTSYFYDAEYALTRSRDSQITQTTVNPIVIDASGQWHGSPSEPIDVGKNYRYNMLFTDGHVRNLPHSQLVTVFNQ